MEIYSRLAELFKIMGDETRIKILYCLSNGEKCVYDIANEVGMSVSAISHQLAKLKSARMVKGIKRGKEVYYLLADDHVEKLFFLATEHVKEER